MLDSGDFEEEEESIIIDRDTVPSNNLSCDACDSSESRYTTKNNRKNIPVDVWLKKPGQNVALSLWWMLSHHHEPQTAERIRFFDVSHKEIRPMHLSEEMPGCIAPVRKEYRVDRIVGHSFQTLYRVRWEGYDISEDLVLESKIVTFLFD